MGHIFYVPFAVVLGVLFHTVISHFAKRSEEKIATISRNEAMKILAFVKKEEKKL